MTPRTKKDIERDLDKRIKAYNKSMIDLFNETFTKTHLSTDEPRYYGLITEEDLQLFMVDFKSKMLSTMENILNTLKKE